MSEVILWEMVAEFLDELCTIGPYALGEKIREAALDADPEE